MANKESWADRNGSGGTTVMESASMAVSDVGAQVRESVADSAALVAQHAPADMTASRGSAEHALVMHAPGAPGMRLDEPAHAGRR